MPWGTNLPPGYLTSRFRPHRDQRTTPVGARTSRIVVLAAHGGDIAVAQPLDTVQAAEPAKALSLAFEPATEVPHDGIYLGEYEGASVFARSTDDSSGSPGTSMQPVRLIASHLSARETSLALSAVGMSAWHRDHRYCTVCARPLTPRDHGWILECAQGHQHFPRTDPAVIVALTDERERLLVAHNRRTRTAMVSVLAGFVEPGEDVESAAIREIHEEVGLAITDLTYRGSQPWPFPRSLMLAFTARVAAGQDPDDLRLQADELTHARWLSRDQFRAERRSGELEIPDTSSIARALIDAWERAEHPSNTTGRA